jgi:hypothetical protein
VSKQIETFRDCHEAGMDYEMALGCSGLDDCAEARRLWAAYEASYGEL